MSLLPDHAEQSREAGIVTTRTGTWFPDGRFRAWHDCRRYEELPIIPQPHWADSPEPRVMKTTLFTLFLPNTKTYEVMESDQLNLRPPSHPCVIFNQERKSDVLTVLRAGLAILPYLLK